MAVSIPTLRESRRRVEWWRTVLGDPREFALVMATLTIIAGTVALAGWWLGIDELKSIVPGVVTMKVNTSIAFILLGSGVLLRARGNRWAIAPLLGAIALAALVGMQYVLGGDSAIDQWLFVEPLGQVGTVHPNRMAPMTVACLLLIGTGVILESRPRWHRLATALLLTALSIAFFNILETLVDPPAPTLLGDQTQMAAITAVTFIVASIGALSLLSLDGAFAGFTGDEQSARLARRLLGASIVVPTVMTTLWLRVQALGVHEGRFGASLAVIGTIAFMIAVIHHSARATQRSEIARADIIEERNRFFDVSLDLLATADARGYFIRLNPAWTTVLGYDLAELTGRPYVDFVHPDDREATNREVTRQTENGQSVLNFRNRYRHRDGRYRWLEWASTPSANGTRLYAMARDITARKLEEDLLTALAAPEREREASQDPGARKDPGSHRHPSLPPRLSADRRSRLAPDHRLRGPHPVRRWAPTRRDVR